MGSLCNLVGHNGCAMDLLQWVLKILDWCIMGSIGVAKRKLGCSNVFEVLVC